MDEGGMEERKMGREELARQARKPHVIVIMADQLRYDVLGTPVTPNLNRLAMDSAVFKRAYCASPLCVPARGAFFTGTYPNTNGCLINPWDHADAQHGQVKSGLPNLLTLMEEDWDSWHVGKQHLLTEERLHHGQTGRTKWVGGMREYKQHLQECGQRTPGGPAFKTLVPEMTGGRTTRAKSYSIPTTGVYEPGFDAFFDGFFAHQAVEAIRGRDTGKPMLLNAMFLAPHPPFDIPEPWHSMWANAPLDLPDNVGHWDSGQSPLQLYNLTGFVGTRYSRAEWDAIWRVYLGLVSLLDHCVGMVVDELKAQGMYEDSLIVFTSDHGEMLGSHGLWQKMCMYEESARVPLYMKLPENRRGASTIETPVSAIDVLPTFCDLLGLEMPKSVQGISLTPLLARDFSISAPGEGDASSFNREYLFIQYDGNGARGNFQRCVISGRHKLIVDLFKDEHYLELYDVEADRLERHNLALSEGNAGLVLEMLERLRQHMSSTGDLLKLPDPGALLRQFLQERA